MKLEGRRCCSLGPARSASPRSADCLSAGAAVTVVAPQATPAIRNLPRTARSPGIGANSIRAISTAWRSSSRPCRKMSPRSIYQEARSRGVLVNSVDDPDNCDFYYPGRGQSRRPPDRDLDGGTQPGARAAHPHRARAAVRPGVRAMDSATGRRAARAVRDGDGSRCAQADAARAGPPRRRAPAGRQAPEWSISSARVPAIQSCSL